MTRESKATGVLYVVTCAAGPARDVGRLVELAQAHGWDVCCILTPSARNFVDMAALESLTSHPVRSEYRKPDEPDVLPPPDAIIVARASFNTINKWASGISDTLALGLVTEAIGNGLPIVTIPAINAAQAKHPAWEQSVATLHVAGVRVLHGGGVYPSASSRARVLSTSLSFHGTLPSQPSMNSLADPPINASLSLIHHNRRQGPWSCPSPAAPRRTRPRRRSWRAAWS
jgi:phosphopantothenoylcysteine decarboxylase